MKVALLGDCHFLVRNGRKEFTLYFEKFFNTIFFPYLRSNNIDTVIQLGDLMDNRTNIPIQGLSECKEYFFSKFDEFDINLISIIGNHDSRYRNTIKINSPTKILREFKNIILIDEPMVYPIKGIDCLFLPWICDENQEKSLELVKTSRAEICFGHLELKDYLMHRGILCDQGMSAELFSGFDMVLSGHFHHKSTKGNVFYVGTPYDLTFHDDSDQKGFHIFDLENRELEFIPNPYKLFNKIYYNDIQNADDIKSKIENNYYNKFGETYIKVIVEAKENQYLYDLFLDSLEKNFPIELSIIEDFVGVMVEEFKEIDEGEDTLTILFKYINNINPKDLNNNKIKTIMSELYNEALELDAL